MSNLLHFPKEGPSHRDQSPEVSARFKRLYERPVLLEVEDLGRAFDGDHGRVIALDHVLNVSRSPPRVHLLYQGVRLHEVDVSIRILARARRLRARGPVLLDGREVRGPGRDRGMVFQGYTLFPWRTVLQNVTFGLELGGASRRKAEAEAREWIELVGLSRFAGAYPYQLSGGMKQRVAIARALANHPRASC